MKLNAAFAITIIILGQYYCSTIFCAEQTETLLPASSKSEEMEMSSRTISFPKDRSLGKLKIRDIGQDEFTFSNFDDFGDARGEVAVPPGKQLRLDVSREAVQDLSPLAKLGPDDLYMVMLWRTEAQDEALKQVAPLAGLEVLDLRFTKITDDGIKYLKNCRSLKMLYLSMTQVGDAGLANVKSIESLEHLGLNQTRITDEGLSHLVSLPYLETLSLGETDITDVGMKYVGQITSLKSLSLWDNYISDGGLARLSNLTALEDLTLHNTKITDTGLSHLKNMHSLKSLRLDRNDIGDAGPAYLQELKSLETLNLQDSHLTDNGLSHLSELQSLKKLHIGPQEGITDAGLKHLAKIESLKELNIGGTNITDSGMDQLTELTHLEVLWIQHSPITDEGLAKFEKLTSLKRLLLNETHVTGNGLAHLQVLPQLRALDISNGFTLGEDRLKHLSGLTQLERLDLPDQIQDDDLIHLANLKHLKNLRIQSKTVSDGGFAHLAGLKSLENVTVWGSMVTDKTLGYLTNNNLEYLQISGNFTDEGLRHLEGLELLRYVRIQGGDFSPDALERLRSLTPSLQNLEIVEARSSESFRPGIGQPAPLFSAKTIDGQELNLQDYHGKVVLLYFWATWCAPCVASTPALKELHSTLSQYENFVMISLSLDEEEYKPRRHAEHYGLQWSQAYIGRDSVIARNYGVHGVPAYFLVGTDGRIITHRERDHDNIKAAVTNALE